MVVIALVSLLVIANLSPTVTANSLVSLVAAAGDGIARSPQSPSGGAGRSPAASNPVPGEPFFTGESANVSRLIESLMRGYDKRLRPNYKGSPVDVGITLFVSSVSSISEVNMDFTLDFYFRQLWIDERLTFDEAEDELCISNEMLDKIWWPDTFFANAKSAKFHLATTKNAFLRIKPSGRITQSLRLTVTAMCAMDLRLFPMDVQVCPLEIESYAYSVKHIFYRWNDGAKDSVSIADNLQLPQFDLRGYKVEDKLEILTTGNYSRLACKFLFVRSLGYYIIQIYIPSSLIVVLSWVSFWLDRNAVPARIALGITTVLTLTTLISSTNSTLPKISYLKSIDVYLVTCFVMVFAALLEYAAVSFIGNRKWKPKQTSKYVSLPPAGSGPCKADSKRCKVRHGGGDGEKASLTFPTSATNDEFAGKSNPLLQDLEMTSPPRKPLSETDARMSASRFSEPGPSGPLLGAMGGGGGGTCPASASNPANHQPGSGQPRAVPPGGGAEEANRPKAPSAPNPNIRKANAIDRYSRVIFPVIFAAFTITYWVTYIHISRGQMVTDFIMP